jgi:hypothetical protein
MWGMPSFHHSIGVPSPGHHFQWGKNGMLPSEILNPLHSPGSEDIEKMSRSIHTKQE